MIPLASPDIRDGDIQRVVEVLRSGMLVQGSEVAGLEAGISGYLKVPHVMAAANGTATLHLALLAAGIGQGDDVIVPSLSYIATANVVELVGARPIFVDIDERTFCIDTTKIEAVITPTTKAIIPVHEFGLMADMEPILSLAERYGLVVIEDAACALGASEGGRMAGSLGDFGSFSLHPRKNITAGEGGLLVCKDPLQADKIRVLRNHGLVMKGSRASFPVAGYNYRLTDIQAALARGQLERIEAILEKRRVLAKLYLETIKHSAITLPQCPDNKQHTWQSFHILLDKAVNRDDLILKLRKAGVGSNLGAQCLPAQEYYAKKYELDVERLFPNGLRAFEQGLVLPLYEKLDPRVIYQVVEILEKEI